MEVLSASVYENEAAIYISLQDLTNQNRIDETTDLFDSYYINRGFDSFASCQIVSFDKETNTATFLINITQANDREIGGNKITFGFREFISKKSKFEGDLSELDLSKAVEAKDTFTPEWFRGASGTDGGIVSPVDGVTVTNMGFIDDKLHIQVYYKDIMNFDNHGYITLYDKSGKKAEYFDVSFFDDEEIGSYDEIIYDIKPDEVNNYTAFGKFVTCRNKTEGFWQVTFPLENIN